MVLCQGLEIPRIHVRMCTTHMHTCMHACYKHVHASMTVGRPIYKCRITAARLQNVIQQTCKHILEVIERCTHRDIRARAQVGLHRNLRSLKWLDNIDMDLFFPRMFNFANPWELQVTNPSCVPLHTCFDPCRFAYSGFLYGYLAQYKCLALAQ